MDAKGNTLYHHLSCEVHIQNALLCIEKDDNIYEIEKDKQQTNHEYRFTINER